MKPISFTVPGPPITQGSKNAYRKGTRTVLVETRHTELENYRERVALTAARYKRPRLDQPLHATIEYVITKPKKPRFNQPAVTPDLDKYIRATFDALTKAGIWKDDARAVSVTARKRYIEPGEQPHTKITITDPEIDGTICRTSVGGYVCPECMEPWPVDVISCKRSYYD